MRFFNKLAILAVLLPGLGHAQVGASLVASEDSIQPGRAVTAAPKLQHEPHWHTYWLNAGTGYPTSLKWELPAGWTAGDIQWPTPIRIRDSQGAVTGNGYEGVLYLPVKLTPPADLSPGAPVTLKATAKWLMCADICIPGSQAVALDLPVSKDTPKPNKEVQAGLASMSMPESPPSAWKVTAARVDNKAVLQISGAGVFESPHFFSEDAYIQYDGPQEARANKDQSLLNMPVADDAPQTDRLIGILAYTDEQGRYRGVAVDSRIDSGEAATAMMASFQSASPKADGGAGGGNETVRGASGVTQSSLLLTLLFALVGGLILNLMPCVFPVLGIKIVGFVNQAGNDRRKVTLHGLIFSAGVLLSFWTLAGILAALRAGGEQAGWGFQLQSPVFVFTLVVVMLVFALSLSGVFDFGLRATTVGSDLQMKEGYVGSFFTGVLATVVATPCSAPFLAPALGAAFTLSIAESFLVFTCIAIGLAAPYLLLSMFPQAVKFLPRPGRWMETFKQAMAFPLYATVGYLLWVLAGQTNENGLLMALLGLTVIAMAAWLYGRYQSPGSPAGRARFGLAGGVILFALGVQMGWPRAMQAGEVAWEPWSAERVEQLRQDGWPIYVDFTARWCATCQTNKKVVFSSDEVRRYFREQNVAALRGDWTNADPLITAELTRWNRSAIPFNLVYRPQGEPQALPEILTPGIVLEAFRGGDKSTTVAADH